MRGLTIHPFQTHPFLTIGGNVVCLDIWRGLDSGPAMHCIHFFFGVGAFIAPLAASPFLSRKVPRSDLNGTMVEIVGNATETDCT